MTEIQNTAPCPIETTMRIIGGKWTFLILRNIFHGDRRFNEIQRHLDGISPRILSQRLQHLMDNGILERRVVPSTPPKVEYHLTTKGRELHPLFQAMTVWGNTWGVMDAHDEAQRAGDADTQ
ncbi:MAG: winged helix-turn-helix transcriptional regulator [Bifidobacterium crudilactis]|uniref:winged helix-turn-helix transcriptional regulator n=1 Tax=Bifidobacterium crudilactis TaxID=327277 RepID=UPI003F9A0528